MVKVSLNSLIRDIHKLVEDKSDLDSEIQTVFPKILSRISDDAPSSPELKRVIDSYELDETVDRIYAALDQLRFANVRIEAQKAIMIMKDGRDDAVFFSLYWEKHDVADWISEAETITTQRLANHLEDEEVQDILIAASEIQQDLDEYKIGSNALGTIKLNTAFNASIRQSNKDIRFYIKEYLAASQDYISKQVHFGVRSIDRVHQLINEIGYNDLLKEFSKKTISQEHARILSYIRKQVEDIQAIIINAQAMTDEIKKGCEAADHEKFYEVNIKLVL